MDEIEKKHHQTFEGIKQNGSDNIEYWSARQLAKVLEYAEYRNFTPVINKAKTACLKSGQVVKDHFVEMHEMVQIGSGAERKMEAIGLSRYACYLIVQNGDPSKPVIPENKKTRSDGESISFSSYTPKGWPMSACNVAHNAVLSTPLMESRIQAS